MYLNWKFLITVAVAYLGLSLSAYSAQKITQNQSKTEEPIRHIFDYGSIEREYFVWLPKDFDIYQTYWALVAVHGGGGNGRTFWLASDLLRTADEINLKVIVISPSFLKEDPNAQRFPVLGEGVFLERMIEDVNDKYLLHPKILLTGYSRGAQFTHRFALWYPASVQACAPLSAGSWTTPEGRFSMYSVGEVQDPKSYLASPKNGEGLRAAQKSLFDPRVAKVAGQPASSGAKGIPFLVMCGTMDERLEITKQFARSLKRLGYSVDTAWPRTMHGGRKEEEYRTEFEKYSKLTVEFFLRNTESKKTEWFKNAGYGVFVHYLYDIQNNPDELHSFGKRTSWDECVNDFNVDTFAKQMSQAGAGYVIFTMHQRTRFLIAPNATFDKKTGYRPGEACSTRDLVQDLYQALNKYNIPLMLYWTGDGPRQDKQAATGLKYNYEKGGHTQVNVEFVKNWAEVVREYGQRYKDKVVGWWVDGCYQFIGYDESKLEILAKGLKSGNPSRIIALNNGVQDQVSFYSKHEDFTCGEAAEFKDIPQGPLEDGKQWHILSYLGTSWGQPGTRFKKPYMIDYIKKVKSSNGVVSIDVMLYRDGSIDQTQLELLKSIKTALTNY